MPPIAFFILLLLQTTSGYPLLLPLLFWQGVFSSLSEGIFWSVLSGIAFGVTFGNFWYWLGAALATNLFLQFFNHYVVRKKTPPVLSLLFLMVIVFWYIPGLTGTLKQVLLLFFPLSFLLFIFYVFWIQKTTRRQKRLF